MRRHEYVTSGQKVTDFLIGFFGWYIGNGILVALSQVATFLINEALLETSPDTSTFETLSLIVIITLGCLPLLLNIAIIVRLSFTRYWISLGALAAFGLILLITLCAAVLLGATCLTILGSYGSQGPIGP